MSIGFYFVLFVSLTCLFFHLEQRHLVKFLLVSKGEDIHTCSLCFRFNLNTLYIFILAQLSNIVLISKDKLFPWSICASYISVLAREKAVDGLQDVGSSYPELSPPTCIDSSFRYKQGPKTNQLHLIHSTRDRQKEMRSQWLSVLNLYHSLY